MIERIEDFKKWLINIGYSQVAIRSKISQIKKLNEIYDIDVSYINDRCASILENLDYCKHKNNNDRELFTLESALKKYMEFLESINPSAKKRVAKFVGNYEGFYSYVNTKCCRIIQDLTRQDEIKRNKGKCSYCGKTVEHLEAAHIKKLSRTDIIRSILDKKYKTKNNLYEVDLVEFEKDFINEHLPLNEHLIYLCHDCHQKYDDNRITEGMMQNKVLKNTKYEETKTNENSKRTK